MNSLKVKKHACNGLRCSGFTLIELLVVIAIIVLLVSILVPSLRKAKELAMEAVCRAHEKGIGTALHLYVTENDTRFPWDAEYWFHYDVLGRYLGEPEYQVQPGLAQAGILQCGPAREAPYQIWPIKEGYGPTYTVNRGLIGQLYPSNPSSGQTQVQLVNYGGNDRFAESITQVSSSEKSFTFADGNSRGVCNKTQLNPFTEGRFFGYTHDEKANVLYLDGHSEGVSGDIWDFWNQDKKWCAYNSKTGALWE